MDELSGAQPFEWLDDRIKSRILVGVPLIVFGAEKHFDGQNFKSDTVSGQFKELRDEIENLAVTRLIPLDRLDPLEQMKRVEKLISDVKNKRPRILFVDQTREELFLCSCNALDGIDQIRRVLLADKLASRVFRDAMQIDISKSHNLTISDDLPPLTPIEVALLDEMTKQGLDVSTQVQLSPFIADFVVTSRSKRIVVEADGAAFHDHDKDAIRDRRIKKEYGLDTLRFSGAEIFSDPSACVSRIQNIINGSKDHLASYQYEGLEVLDTSQRSAVDHDVRDARILAPAGSGKTKVLINRVIRLLNNGVAPSSVIVLAFNKKAAQQLEERLFVLGIPTGKGRPDDNGVWVATLNSFGFRVLRSEGNTSKILDASWKEKALVEQAVEEIGHRLIPMRGEDPMATLTREIARVRRGLYSPVGVEVDLRQPKGTATVDLGAIWSRVREEQALSNVITFDDQIFLAADLLLKEPISRQGWQGRFTNVLVDEYQDLNPTQILLLQILTAGPSSIFAVGDDDQVIYSWRDASVVNLLENFEQSYPGMETFTLDTNYRCPKPIVRSSQRLIKRNKRRYPKDIKPSEIAPEGMIEISRAEGLIDLGGSLSKFLQRQNTSDGDEWRDMAVLTRTKVQLLAAALAMDKANIPRSPLPQVRLFSTPVAKRLISYISLVCSAPFSCSGEDLAFIVNQPNRFVRNVDVDKVRSVNDPWTFVNVLAFGCPKTVRPNEELKRFVKDILEIQLMTKDEKLSAVDIVDSILSRFKIAVPPDEASHSADDATDEIILHLMRETSRNHFNIADFLEHAVNAAADEVSEVREDTPQEKSKEDAEIKRNQVTLSTIHGAKGREWAVVSLFDVSSVSSTNRQNENIDNEEERRIFYVGMTRAMKCLNISYVAEKADPYIGEALLPNELIGKQKNDAVSWLARNTKKLESAEKLLSDKITAIENLDQEISGLISGKLVSDLKKKIGAVLDN